jgi:hypothetical protein
MIVFYSAFFACLLKNSRILAAIYIIVNILQCDICYRSIPEDRLKQIMDVLEQDIMVR